MRLVSLLSALVLAVLFLFSAGDKVAHYQGFVNALSSYVLVPARAAPWLAPAVVLAEAWVGIGLLVPRWRTAAALAACVLLALFTAALAVNYRFADSAVCGCWFTVTLARSTGGHLARNALLIAVAASAWLDLRSRRGASPDTTRSVPQPGADPAPTPAPLRNPQEVP